MQRNWNSLVAICKVYAAHTYLFTLTFQSCTYLAFVYEVAECDTQVSGTKVLLMDADLSYDGMVNRFLREVCAAQYVSLSFHQALFSFATLLRCARWVRRSSSYTRTR
jgi:hypothetical protein